MEILVDYNNVLEVHRRKGVRYVAERILHAIGPHRLTGRMRVSLRLYDGWYEQQAPTRVAQHVSADVQANTPHTTIIADGAQRATVLVNIELAYSLRSEPMMHLWHTFRPRTPQSNLSCTDPRLLGCQIPNCPLLPAQAFIAQQRCPENGCALTPNDLFVRNEQKLVDTMIAADLFSLFMTAAPSVVLVSSDDDHLPIIRMLARTGMTVIHVLTRPPHPSIRLYLQDLDPSKYIQAQM